jgi:hypothetical protein
MPKLLAIAVVLAERFAENGGACQVRRQEEPPTRV